VGGCVLHPSRELHLSDVKAYEEKVRALRKKSDRRLRNRRSTFAKGYCCLLPIKEKVI
jgi:hypothetical protein